MSQLPGRQGSIVWALVLYENERPFNVVADDRVTPYESAADLARAVQNQELGPELTVEVGAKVRPVLLLQDRPAGRLKEYAALKITRLAKLDTEMQELVRAQRAPHFFHLRTTSGPEQAVDLLSLTRVHDTAILSNQRGKLNENEFRVVCERLVRAMDLDLANVVAHEASDLIKRLGYVRPS